MKISLVSVAVLLAVLVTLAMADPEPQFGRGGYGRGGGFGRGGFGRGGFGGGGFGRGGFGRGGFGGYRGRRSVDAEVEAADDYDAVPFENNFDDSSLVFDRLRREASPEPEPQRFGRRGGGGRGFRGGRGGGRRG